MKRALLPLVPLFAAFSLCGCLSCSANPDVLALWGGDATPPTLLSVTPVSPFLVEISFSGPVTVVEASAAWSPPDAAERVTFEFDRPVPVGAAAVIDASVIDSSGNTLSFAVPFSGYNDRPARLAINEVRVSYSKPKAEYIEFTVLESGNLAGIQIVNARNEKRPLVELPALEVSAGDMVVWHLRSVDEGLVTETRARDESSGVDSCPDAWDLWDDQTSAPLKPTNAILVRTRTGGTLQDALLSAETAAVDWPNEACRAAAREAFDSGLWPGGAGVAGAVLADGMSPTRTLGKTPAGAWLVCPTGKCSPGRENWVP